ncbi:hypothetical protein BGZ61DRAFT_470026 [Ilyonectria robusta]|uniref:uncharacterized protein n=1 Tax=Ilyonectria robusta TaxID=1079257 RepID=UPI001E8E61D6|nr:uncharacterized protein BGZ61DRAFT_470026 [Ilyonectria robusta]KAH8646433.1 hypothetical protein BGZ61DRAFT_470026 [Ilyonectria robusta]
MERLDLVVIGAGWYGLAAAKQYRCFHPGGAVAVIDSGSSIGGVWAKELLYPGLKSNNLIGSFQYPDFPMDEATFGVKPRHHIPGIVVNRYLNAYAEKFDLVDIIRLRSKVESAEHQSDGGWILYVRRLEDQDSSAGSKVFTRRLVLATGLVSQPFKPHIRGQEEFGHPLFHSKEFANHTDTFESGKKVTIFGGTKFAWDAVYAYAMKGIKVDWIIRPTGHGPCWMSPPFVTPFKIWIEYLVNIRLVHWFAPCIWGQDSGFLGIKRFWHGTAIGRKIVDLFWNVISSDVIGLMGFNENPEFKKLEPTSEAMYDGCSFSILNYDTDFFQPIRDGTVKIHSADLSHLSSGQVHLDDASQTVLDTDAMLFVTGWKNIPALKFLPEGIDRKIGMTHHSLPLDRDSDPDDGLAEQADLLAKADAEILARFPRLKIPPNFNPDYKPLTQTKAFSIAPEDKTAPVLPETPMMLYHLMVPGTSELLKAKDIAVAGSCMNFSNPITAHIQGLWISAYFEGKLRRDPSSAVLPRNQDSLSEAMTLDQVHYETVLHNRFGRWRYPNDPGSKHGDFIFEAVPYMDMMMADLGLKVHRKSGWLREIIEPYVPEDYADINDEWHLKYGKTD